MAGSHVIKPLTPETYPAWLALAQKHNGVWGGCSERERRRILKRRRQEAAEAQAAETVRH